MSEACRKLYKKCELCAKRCGIDRMSGKLGYCGTSAEPTVARAALHMWEEPVISGTRGSGTVFFCGCSLGCIYCQNGEISRGNSGIAVSTERLAEILTELEEKGAHNINFVTPTHFAPSVVTAVAEARERGLSVPIVYNTGSYDTVDTLRMLRGTVNVYLPDFKYYRSATAKKLSHAADYPEVAKAAIAEMVRQQPAPIIEGGIMRRGVIVRVLLLPGHLAEAKLNVKYLHDTYGDSIYISLMNQYTPPVGMPTPLDRRVTHAEYDELTEYAVRLGVKHGFTQEWGTAKESFTPAFDNTGVIG